MSRTRLELTLGGVLEERDDRWSVRCQEFGFTVYGHTQEEAERAFLDAVTALITSFGDDSALRDYLDKKGVQHRFARQTTTSHERGAERYFERRFEVAIGAAQ